jgi:hypothetical protein
MMNITGNEVGGSSRYRSQKNGRILVWQGNFTRKKPRNCIEELNRGS